MFSIVNDNGNFVCYNTRHNSSAWDLALAAKSVRTCERSHKTVKKGR